MIELAKKIVSCVKFSYKLIVYIKNEIVELKVCKYLYITSLWNDIREKCLKSFVFGHISEDFHIPSITFVHISSYPTIAMRNCGTKSFAFYSKYTCNFELKNTSIEN